jgi:uncharacterized protein (TIGR02679 family)
MKLKGLTPDEADAIAGLLGVPRPADNSIRVSLTRLDSSLRSSVIGLGLVEVLSGLGGPLIDRRAVRQRGSLERAEVWAQLRAHPAAVINVALPEWLDQIRASGLARRLAGDDEGEALRRALDVVAVVQEGRRSPRLAVLAAEITGNAHGLDRGKPAGTLAVHALSWLAEQPFPRDAADWRRAWAEAGVACDDLSCDVLVLNLPGWASEPLRLTLRQVALWQPKAQNARARMVYVTENPAIIAATEDHFGDRSPTMVCLDGIPSTAALVLLHGLVTAGYAVRYHGDFDWRGLAIAGVLVRKVPSAQPWRFTTTDYLQAVRQGLGTVPLSGAPHMSPWDPELAPIMKTAGTAIYEEQVIEDLLEDLDNSRREPDQPKRSPGRGRSA